MITCQQCKKNVATVHVTEIVNKQKNEIHLCEQCAREQNITGMPLKASMNVTELLNSLIGQGDTEKTRFVDKTCPSCGISYSEFRSGGRLGCANDYHVFEDALIPLIEKVHGTAEHTGKVPKSQSESISRPAEIRRAKAQLKEAVGHEDYETAARLRDQIKELEGNE